MLREIIVGENPLGLAALLAAAVTLSSCTDDSGDLRRRPTLVARQPAAAAAVQRVGPLRRQMERLLQVTRELDRRGDAALSLQGPTRVAMQLVRGLPRAPRREGEAAWRDRLLAQLSKLESSLHPSQLLREVRESCLGCHRDYRSPDSVLKWP